MSTKQQFPLGQICATPGALEALQVSGQPLYLFTAMHVVGFWGDLCDEDKQANDLAVEEGSRIFSAYRLKDDTKIWVITEADRSVTTVMLPEEY